VDILLKNNIPEATVEEEKIEDKNEPTKPLDLQWGGLVV
jgi:hypothetical protein